VHYAKGVKEKIMRLASVYVAVVLIWSTTPLGIRFSVESLDFIQALAIRMWLSLVLCIFLLKLFSIKLSWARPALYSYALGAMAISGAMLCVYWAAQILPSGLIAVVWGLAPLVVCVYAWKLIPNSLIGLNRFLCMLLAVWGLYTIFAQQISLGYEMVVALLVLLVGVNLHGLSSVLLQRLQLVPNQPVVHPLAQTTGALIISAPIYALVWINFSGPLPETISIKSISAVVYLATFGSVAGFIGYFYLLNNMSAANVSLITLITPVVALLLGSYLANESLETDTWLGALMIMLALFINQFSQVRLMVVKLARYSLPKA
jgi:drug/metabolite transporter (DMT)-like permease